MEPKLVGRVTVGTLAVVFGVVALVYALYPHHADTAVYHVLQGVVFAVVALSCAVCYRYFED